jgi:tRNA(Ile)-lysidine synthase
MQNTLLSFSDHIVPTDTLILAVSGGVDSMVLLDLVLQVHPHDRIIVGHVDHCLRGSESDGDREFVMETCARPGVRCETTRIDIATISRESHMGIEATARRERYQFLRGLRDSYHARYIVTAHHADDQMETILLNLIK